jgi:outer membrane protein OmpA-like peptidoglycan-associated protein
MRIIFSLLVGAALASAIVLPAAAQSNPSAQDLINSLKPTGAIGSGTRGIRPSNGGAIPAPTPAATPTPAAVAPSTQTAAVSQPRPAVPEAPAKAPSANLQVQFASNSADLTPSARATLDELGRALSSADLAGYHFRIEGHTDTVGSPELNKSLSERRAEAVVNYLAQTYHVDPARLQAVGMGSDDLAVPTGPQVPEPRNRRVQVVNVGA